ncbi:transcription factor Adf-1 [Ixodes scapularis]
MASSPLVISAPTGWMPGDVLIDAVKKYPVLYDKRHERYKDNDFKEEIWKTIGSRFGVSGSKCQTKFKNLKDTYVKIRNQIKKSVKNGVGAGTVPNIKWKHFKTMLDIMEPMYDEKLIWTNIGFIREEASSVEQHVTSVDVVPSPVPDESLICVYSTEWEGPATFSNSIEPRSPVTPASRVSERSPESMDQEPDTGSDSDRMPRPKKLARLSRRQESCVNDTPAARTNRTEMQDTIYHFCMTLAGQLRELSPGCQFETMNEIQNLVYPKIRQAMAQGASPEHAYTRVPT